MGFSLNIKIQSSKIKSSNLFINQLIINPTSLYNPFTSFLASRSCKTPRIEWFHHCSDHSALLLAVKQKEKNS